MKGKTFGASVKSKDTVQQTDLNALRKRRSELQNPKVTK